MGLDYKAVPRSRECCSQVESEVVSNNSRWNKIHQTCEWPISEAPYMIITDGVSPYVTRVSKIPSKRVSENSISSCVHQPKQINRPSKMGFLIHSVWCIRDV